MLCLQMLASGGLVFAFNHATVAGKLILLLLAIGSIFSWSIMLTKLRVIRYAQKQNARFPGSPVFNVYRAGCEEMAFQLLGSPEVDETFRARLGTAEKISPAQMG